VKQGKKSLITGITGQDGAYLARFLLARGHRVTGVLSKGHKHSLQRLKLLGVAEKIEWLTCDLKDPQGVGKLLSKARPQEIYNLAAISSVGLSFEAPYPSVYFNVLTITALLEAVRRLKLDAKIYQASSSEMFGNAKKFPANENTLLNPISPYATSKLAGHMLVRNYRLAYKIFCCSGILFNHESVLRPDNFVTKKILSTAIRIAHGSREKLYLGNTAIKRDWGYAPEYVKAMWLMLQAPAPDDFVIASGETHSLQEFVELVFENLGLDSKKHVETDKNFYRAMDISMTLGDSTKAKKVLGWKYAMPFPKLVSTLVRDEVHYQKYGAIRDF